MAGQIEQVAPRKRIRRDEITGEPLPVQPEEAEGDYLSVQRANIENRARVFAASLRSQPTAIVPDSRPSQH